MTLSVIMDSEMSFAEAIEGTVAPLQVIDFLSLLDVLYYSFDGLLHQGQVVVHAALEEDVWKIFLLMKKLKFPVHKAVPIAAYHWDDEASMADNNSSGFNFRVIEGTSKFSLHSFGRAIDLNPLQNPVIYSNGLTAPTGARYRPDNKGVLTADHPVVREFIRLGWRWGGDFDQPKDYHHFEKTG